jgi:hypothetical protein
MHPPGGDRASASINRACLTLAAGVYRGHVHLTIYQ